MASERQLQANRRNGSKGGPKTEAGKQACRLNSLKHGLTSTTLVVLPEESENEYHQVLRGFRDSFQPETPVEDALVVRLAQAHWRSLRSRRVETGILDITATTTQTLARKQVENCPDHLNPHNAIAVGFLINPADPWQTYLRYDAAISRDFFRTMDALMRLQRERQRNIQPPERILALGAGASHSATQLSDSGIGSVLKTEPFTVVVERGRGLVRHNSVTRFVLCLAAFLTLAPLFAAADPELTSLLEGLENRYNKVKTLQVAFEESYMGSGRPRRAETGELSLRKPGRMRWEYAQPAGKLFLSDGKLIYYYNPVSKRAEKIKVRESEDMRAPLAFLLGKLDFQKDFTDFKLKPAGADRLLIAKPKSPKLPYKQVEFTVSPQNEIKQLIVSGHDDAVLIFRFSNERLNPALDEAMFRFQLPEGATWHAGPEPESN